MKAVWNGRLVAESDDTVIVEGNHYFPRAALREDVITPSDTTTFCPWKGTARYYHLVVDGCRVVLPGAAGGCTPDRRPRGVLARC